MTAFSLLYPHSKVSAATDVQNLKGSGEVEIPRLRRRETRFADTMISFHQSNMEQHQREVSALNSSGSESVSTRLSPYSKDRVLIRPPRHGEASKR